MSPHQKQLNVWLAAGRRFGLGLILGVFLSFYVASFPLGMRMGAVLGVVFVVVGYIRSEHPSPTGQVLGDVDK